MNPTNQLLLNSLQLEDIFCYQQMEVSFESGVSVFAGDNGSGKSSLMESIFFGLFGSKTKNVTGKELSEVLREGQRNGTLILKFSFSNSDYIAQLTLKRTGERVSAEGPKCLLFKDGVEVASKVNNVTSFIQSMLKMDAEDFANCLYVCQGEVDRLINAKPQDRQRMIDRLLRLTKIDDYERRLKPAVTALKRRKTLVQGRIDTLSQDVEQLKAQQLGSQILKHQKELAHIEATQQALRGQVEEAQNHIRHLQETLARYEQTSEAMKQLQGAYTQATQRLQTTDVELDQVGQQQQRIQQNLQTLKAEQTALQQREAWQQQGLPTPVPPELLDQLRQDQVKRTNAVQGLKDALIELRSECKTSAKALEEARAQLAALAPKLTGHEATLTQLEDQIKTSVRALRQLPPGPLEKLPLARWAKGTEHKLAEQRQAKQQLREKAAALAADLRSLEKEQQRIKALVDEGHCPTCHQPVTLEHLADHSRPLARRIASNRQQLTEINAQLKALDGQIKTLESEAQTWADVLDRFKQWGNLCTLRETLLPQLEQWRQKAEQLEAQLTQLNAKETALVAEGKQATQALDEGKSTLRLAEQSLQLQENMAQCAQDQDGLRKRQQTLLQLRDNQRRELQQLSERFDALKAQLEGQSPEGLKKELSQYQQQHETLTQQLKLQQRQRDDLQHRLGQLNTQQQRLEQQTQRLAAQRKKADALEALHEEVEQLQQVYQHVKASQRQNNFDALNALFDHFFTLMQPGPAYHGVRLNPACDIEVVRTNGQTIGPALLSGGERALLNLALRAALHQVICEAGGVLLPLFFDEPTVFLDTHHVQRLERLFEALGQRVGQVVVVSHDSALVEGTAHEYLVSKDADNIGWVEKVR